MRTPLRSVLFLLLLCLIPLAASTGCDGDDPASIAATSNDDPDLAVVFETVQDFRARVVASGLDGESVRELAADGSALSRRIGYTDDEIAARNARFLAAVEALKARHPEATSPATACATCGADAIAAWVESSPRPELRKIPYLCEIYPLVVDIVGCLETTDFMSDAMWGCVGQAFCNNCNDC